MARAFVLLTKERRVDHEARQRYLSEHGREVPIHYENEPIVTTVGKVLGIIGSLLGIILIILTAYGWLLSNRFQHIVDERFSQSELRLMREYALKSDVPTRVEYELRHTELIQRDAQQTDRMNELEKRIRDLEKNGRR